MPDSAQALYLMSKARTVAVTDATLEARWGVAGHIAETTSCLTSEAAATAEAVRRIGFSGGPLAQEQALIGKVLAVDALRGRCVTLDGVVVFVLGGAVDHGAGTTVLDVLRRP